MGKEKILFVNACVRKESRTKRLADCLLKKLGGDVQEVRLENVDFPKTDEKFLQKRDSLIAKREFSDSMFNLARDFAGADIVVVAAPFWDLSFPAVLKQYFEQITVSGITYVYSDEGIPKGLCRAKKLYYVTTAGGKIFAEDYGYGYVKMMANGFYGIEETEIIKAECLDIVGADVEAIMKEAEKAYNL